MEGGVPVPIYRNRGYYHEMLETRLAALPANCVASAMRFVRLVMRPPICPMVRNFMIDGFLRAIENWEVKPHLGALKYLCSLLDTDEFPVKLLAIESRMESLRLALLDQEPEWQGKPEELVAQDQPEEPEVAQDQSEEPDVAKDQPEEPEVAQDQLEEPEVAQEPVPLMEQFQSLPKPKPISRRVLLEAAGQEELAYKVYLQELQAHHKAVGLVAVTVEEAALFEERLLKARQDCEEARPLDKPPNPEDGDEDEGEDKDEEGFRESMVIGSSIKNEVESPKGL